MTEQNPTEKGAAPEEIKVLLPKCPSCGNDLGALNISTMTIPVPQDPRGDWSFMVPCCPHPECGKVVPAHFFGFVPRDPGQVATPPQGLWRPS